MESPSDNPFLKKTVCCFTGHRVIEEAHRQNPMPKWPDAGMKR